MRLVQDGPDIPDRLIQAHEEGEVVFFCGAGVSFPAGLPGFRDLVSQVYTHIGAAMSGPESEAFKADQYDSVVQLLERRVDSGLVRSAIETILTPPRMTKRRLATHRALLKLSTDRSDRVRLVTTNFDRLFIAADKRARTLVAPLLPVPKKSQWNGVVYLHGLLPGPRDHRNLNQLVVSSGDFGLAYLTERWGSRFVSELFRSYVVCFVGYQVADPVLRYMVDALWADRRVGEAERPVYAFGPHGLGQESQAEEAWYKKGISPILYRESDQHALLHQTLRRWADVYGDGLTGKQQMVSQDAKGMPSRIAGDGQIDRVLWALSDQSGVCAQTFGRITPPAPVEWLEVLREPRFKPADLSRFGVNGVPADANLEPFSVLSRIPPAKHSAPLRLVYRASRTVPSVDPPMFYLCHWVADHLDKEQVVEWVVKDGPVLHPTLADIVRHKLRNPGLPAPLQKFWSLVVSERTSGYAREGLPQWVDQLKVYGWNVLAKEELRRNLRPLVRLTSSRSGLRDYLVAKPSRRRSPTASKRFRDLVDGEIVLGGGPHVGIWIRDRAQKLPVWRSVLTAMSSEFTSLLLETFELLEYLEHAAAESDLSYISRPSIATHQQNHGFSDWDILVDLCRDALLENSRTALSPARKEVERWRQLPYPIFRRLTFFAAAHTKALSVSEAVVILREANGWWLFSAETQKEALEVIERVAREGTRRDKGALLGLILKGPPRRRFRAKLSSSDWRDLVDRSIWLRLATYTNAGGILTGAAVKRRDAIAKRQPTWTTRLKEAEILPYSMSSGGPSPWRKSVQLPRDVTALAEALRTRPADSVFYQDDWVDICEKDLSLASAALRRLANTTLWPEGIWAEALQRWAQPALVSSTWATVAPMLGPIPDEAFVKLLFPVGYYLRNAGESVGGDSSLFFLLVNRVLDLSEPLLLKDSEDPVQQAINHPVGYVVEGTFQWWYAGKPNAAGGISSPAQVVFQRVATPRTRAHQCGLVIVASNLASLSLADHAWTVATVIPAFDWGAPGGYAQIAWEGYLWAPRMSRDLLLALKHPLLTAASHYADLKKHGEQYVGLLVWSALEFPDVISGEELRIALDSVPAVGLASGVRVLASACANAKAQADDLWRHRVKPILVHSWPKANAKRTPDQSSELAELCATLDGSFPEAVDTVLPLAGKAGNLYIALEALAARHTASRYPGQVLRLLDRVVDTAAQLAPEHLGTVLDEIANVDATVKGHGEFRRLMEFVNTKGR